MRSCYPFPAHAGVISRTIGERESMMSMTDTEFQQKMARIRQIKDDLANGKPISQATALEALALCESLTDDIEEVLNDMDAATRTIN